MEPTVPAHKKKKPRSPSYPGIGLEQAIERARILHEQERQNSAPVDAILHHWGYKPKSGAGLVILAALKKFGLLEDEGSGDARTAKLTARALDVLLDPRADSPERAKAIQDAARAPGIHREILEGFPEGLPSDATLEHYLIRDRLFTQSAARELINELRGTLAFAGLAGAADTVTRQEQDRLNDEENLGMSGTATEQRERHPPPPPPPAGAELAIPVLLTGGQARVKLQGTFPVTEEEWDRMIALLNAHKAGLIASPPTDDK